MKQLEKASALINNNLLKVDNLNEDGKITHGELLVLI